MQTDYFIIINRKYLNGSNCFLYVFCFASQGGRDGRREGGEGGEGRGGEGRGGREGGREEGGRDDCYTYSNSDTTNSLSFPPQYLNNNLTLYYVITQVEVRLCHA